MVTLTPNQGPPSYVLLKKSFIPPPSSPASDTSSDISDDLEPVELIEASTSSTPAASLSSIDFLSSSSPTENPVTDDPLIHRVLSATGDALQMTIQSIRIAFVVSCLVFLCFTMSALQLFVQAIGTAFVMSRRIAFPITSFAFIGVLAIGIFFPFISTNSSSDLRFVDYCGLMSIQNSTITSLMSSSGVSYLSADLKKTEMATSELALLVFYSDLPGHDQLAHELKTLSSTASSTSDSPVFYFKALN
ncbi:hypothetical protein D9758_012168 [Tetrapyrgos nigripes]|uniref:Uncharacterized protein n=1 Tax=Tetrapyrgos nigripes TaxID=182062 RepID=A0A8H5CG90_9AGAR|nr:hypothetical protein D9758_012168 [Tetrapyrgos nigripes]